MLRILLIVLIGLLSAGASNTTQELPCHMLDSVDITYGIRQPDGSILYDDIMYPRSQYATVDYIVEEGVKKFDDFSHIRGCACNIKPCIRLCCPLGTYRTEGIDGKSCLPHPQSRTMEAVVLDEKNEKQILNLGHHFAWIIDGYPCKSMYPTEDYHITYNGQVLHENQYLTHHNYCLYTALVTRATDLGNGAMVYLNETQFRLLVCFNDAATPSHQYTAFAYAIVILSALFVILTLLIYACLPKLHTLQGKCMICYLIALAFGYILIAYLVISGHENIKPNMCRLIAFLVLTSLMSSFLWLNVLNFNLWLSIYPTELFKHWTDTEKLQLYALYGFGFSYIWTLFVYLLNSIDSLPEFLQPRVSGNGCFLDNMYLYFYLPSGITFVINIVLFVSICLTVCREKVKQEPDQQVVDSKMKQKLPDKLFFELSAVMFIIWIIELVTYLFAPNSSAFLIFCNAVQGVIIFILLVLNRNVLNLIKERWQDRAKAISNRPNAPNPPPNELSSS